MLHTLSPLCTKAQASTPHISTKRREENSLENFGLSPLRSICKQADQQEILERISRLSLTSRLAKTYLSSSQLPMQTLKTRDYDKVYVKIM